MKNIFKIIIISLVITYTSCNNEEHDFDASGSFETEEIIISSQATGKILTLNLEEGQTLPADTIIGQIDVSLLQLQLEQIDASAKSLYQKTGNAKPQINIYKAQLKVQDDQIITLNEQMKILDKEISRFENLVAANASPQKQLDDLNGQKSVLLKQLDTARRQKEVINEQINAASSNTKTQNKSILSELEPTKKRMELLEKQISDATIVNEYAGTVITKYANQGEFTTVGKPLYKIADLSTMILRVYITGNQLPQVRLNQKVTVITDDGEGAFNESEGTVSWISSRAEFTPKTIQTKDERANQVYAMKIKVKNDGSYKIGMYGEVKFLSNE